MKFTAAILASLYLFIALHSAMTVLHFNINQQEIKAELCKYKDMTIPLCGGGVCYLQDQLSLSFDTTSTDEDNATDNSIVFELKQLLHVLPTIVHQSNTSEPIARVLISRKPILTDSNYRGLSAPPPQFV